MLDIARLIIDFGIAFFLWSIQIILIPSLQWLEGEDLQRWTSKYFERGLSFVMPIYPLHLCIVGIQFYYDQNLYTSVSLVLIIFVWIVAIKVISPGYRKIIAGIDLSMDNRKRLYRHNWYRSLTSLILFFMSLVYYLEKMDFLSTKIFQY